MSERNRNRVEQGATSGIFAEVDGSRSRRQLADLEIGVIVFGFVVVLPTVALLQTALYEKRSPKEVFKDLVGRNRKGD